MADIIPTLTPKMAEYIRAVVAQADVVDRKVPLTGAKHAHDHLHRFANSASALGLVTLHGDSGAVVVSWGTYVVVTRQGAAALRKYDQGTLPAGVRILTDGTVTDTTGGGKIGRLRRSGAMTAAAVTWSAYGWGDESAHLGDFRGNRIAAARAVCKHAGIELPGE